MSESNKALAVVRARVESCDEKGVSSNKAVTQFCNFTGSDAPIRGFKVFTGLLAVKTQCKITLDLENGREVTIAPVFDGTGKQSFVIESWPQ